MADAAEGAIPSGLGKLAALETLDFYGHLSHGKMRQCLFDPPPDVLSDCIMFTHRVCVYRLEYQGFTILVLGVR